MLGSPAAVGFFLICQLLSKLLAEPGVPPNRAGSNQSVLHYRVQLIARAMPAQAVAARAGRQAVLSRPAPAFTPLDYVVDLPRTAFVHSLESASLEYERVPAEMTVTRGPVEYRKKSAIRRLTHPAKILRHIGVSSSQRMRSINRAPQPQRACSGNPGSAAPLAAPQIRTIIDNLK